MFRESRLAAKKTMGDVARLMDVSVAYVSDVERGTRPPFSPDRIRKASTAFGFGGEKLEGLLAEAAACRGAFELGTENATEKHMTVGAALMRGWPELTDQQLDEINEIVGRNRG